MYIATMYIKSFISALLLLSCLVTNSQKYFHYDAAIISLFAGTPNKYEFQYNVPATDGQLYLPYSNVIGDSLGNIYISDMANHRIQKVSSDDNIISLYAGSTVFPPSCAYSGDGSAATDATMCAPHFVWINTIGNVYFADAGNGRIRVVDRITGFVDTVIGGGVDAGGNAIAATDVSLNDPRSIWGDSNGNLFVTDSGYRKIRKVDSSNIITTYAGNGNNYFDGDNGPSAEASFAWPYVSWGNSIGELFVADYQDNRIRKIDHN